MYMSLLVAMALMLHIVERQIPVPFITPGAKLGLTNLVTVIALYTMPKAGDVLKIIGVRLVVSTLFGGPVSSLLYSSAGACFSFFAMVCIKKLGKEYVSIIGVSAAGAVFHNIGQLLMASLIVWNSGVMLYLPVLTVAGIGTGIFVGMAANYTTAHMYKLAVFRNLLKEKG